MPTPTLRGLALGVTALAGLMAAAPATAQTPPPCAEQIAKLDQRIEALRGGSVTPPATRAELDTLAVYRRALEQVGQGSPAQACAAVLDEAMATAQAVESPRVLPADDFDDRKLRTAQGEEMGEIGELIVDPASGRIVYAVVELGGFLGMGERYFPVPWALVRPAPEGDAFILNVGKDRLTAAPQFTRDNRPNMADRQWALALHTYYGVTPHWLDRSTALAAVLPAGSDGQAAAAQRQEAERLKAEVERLNAELAQMRAAGASGAAPAPGATGGTDGAAQPPAPAKP